MRSSFLVPLLLLGYCFLLLQILKLAEERDRYKIIGLEDKKLIFRMARKIGRLQEQLKKRN